MGNSTSRGYNLRKPSDKAILIRVLTPFTTGATSSRTCNKQSSLWNQRTNELEGTSSRNNLQQLEIDCIHPSLKEWFFNRFPYTLTYLTRNQAEEQGTINNMFSLWEDFNKALLNPYFWEHGLLYHKKVRWTIEPSGIYHWRNLTKRFGKNKIGERAGQLVATKENPGLTFLPNPGGCFIGNLTIAYYNLYRTTVV